MPAPTKKLVGIIQKRPTAGSLIFGSSFLLKVVPVEAEAPVAVEPGETIRESAEVLSTASGERYPATLPFGKVPGLVSVSDMLPAYMLPSVVVGIDEWPRVTAGKIDRNALPERRD